MKKIKTILRRGKRRGKMAAVVRFEKRGRPPAKSFDGQAMKRFERRVRREELPPKPLFDEEAMKRLLEKMKERERRRQEGEREQGGCKGGIMKTEMFKKGEKVKFDTSVWEEFVIMRFGHLLEEVLVVLEVESSIGLLAHPQVVIIEDNKLPLKVLGCFLKKMEEKIPT